jgi:hypothetical protein
MPEDSIDWRDFEIEQSGASGGTCDCCGSTTKRIWGFAHRNGGTTAAYFVAWTEGKADHGAKFDLILGKWGDKAAQADRYVVALDFHIGGQAPEFVVVDAHTRGASFAALAATTLSRSDVIGTPLAAQVYAVVDAIYMSDGVEAVRAWSNH